jgi:hypothetical protein
MARGRHAKPPRVSGRTITSLAAAGAVVSMAGAGWSPLLQAAPATSHISLRLAAYSSYHTPRRLIAWRWARTQWGAPYVWGGTGPGYDCSGLVMMAYRHAGIYLPRTTYEMLASGMLIWEPRSQARWGDLAFYGSGHVELYIGNDVVNETYGAHDFGTVVSPTFFNSFWEPTAYYRVAGAS